MAEIDIDALVAKLASVKLFESLSEFALRNIASHLEPVEFGPHDRIIRQGDFGDKFFIIEEGEVEVYVHGKFVVNLKEGTFFGEQALLTNAPRNASIVAAENGCKCLEMSRTNFETYLGPLRQLMDRVNERRQLVAQRKKMMKSKLGSRMAALDRLINPDLAAELDAQEHADKDKSSGTPTSAAGAQELGSGGASRDNNGGSDGGTGSNPDDWSNVDGGTRGRYSRRRTAITAPPRRQRTRSNSHSGTRQSSKSRSRVDEWRKAVQKEKDRRTRIDEANQELLQGAAMTRQTSDPASDEIVQAALKSGTAMVVKTQANTAPPPPPPRRHALQHNCHSWVVWESHWSLNAINSTMQANQDTWLKATTAKSYQLRESQKRRVFMGEIWKFVGTPIRIHNHIQLTIHGTEPLFTPAASKLSRVMLQTPTISSTLWQKIGLLNDSHSWQPYHFALVGPVLFRFPTQKSSTSDWAIVLKADETQTDRANFRGAFRAPTLGLYRSIKGINKGYTFALADEDRYSSDSRSPKARHRRRPSQQLELDKYRDDSSTIPGLHMFATPSEELHRMWIAAISHVIEPQDWHRRSEQGQDRGSAVGAVRSAEDSTTSLPQPPHTRKEHKKRRSLNPFERKQKVLARFRAAVQQVLKSLHTGRSIVGRTNTSHLNVLKRRIKFESVHWLEKQLKAGMLHQLAALVIQHTQPGLGTSSVNADVPPSPFDVGNLTLPLTAIECFRAVVNRKKGMQALLDSGGVDLLQITCFAFGVQHDADRIRQHIGTAPPFNMMLFSQVVDILISLSAFSDRGRSVVESVMNQIALLWMLTREEEQKQNATTHDGTEEKAGNDSPPPTAAMLPPMSKDKMWGLLNFYLNLTRHLQRGKQCMPLQAKEKLLGLLNTLVMSTGSAVHRGAVRAQLKQCGFDQTRTRLRQMCEQLMLHDTLMFIVNDIDAKFASEGGAANTTVTDRFMSVFTGLSQHGELTEKQFVEALLNFTNSQNDNARKSDFINAFYMLDQSCDGRLSYLELETAVTEFEFLSKFKKERETSRSIGTAGVVHEDDSGDEIQVAEAVLRQLDIYEQWLEQDEKQEAEILGKLNMDDLAICLSNRIKNIESDNVRGTVRKVVEKLIIATHNHEAMTSSRSFLRRMRLQLDSMIGELPGEEEELLAEEMAHAAALDAQKNNSEAFDDPEQLAARRAAAAAIAARHGQSAATTPGPSSPSMKRTGSAGSPTSMSSRHDVGDGGDSLCVGAASNGPDLSKYMRMLKMGLPRGAVEQKMRSDGLDPSLLDSESTSSPAKSGAPPPPPPAGLHGGPPPPPAPGGIAGGPPGPPPPPPGVMGAALGGKKKKGTKKSKLRKLNWPMLDYCETPGTCWETIEKRAKKGVGPSEATIPTDQIDAIFTVKEKKKRKKGKGKGRGKKKLTKKGSRGGKKLELLDDKRAFQLNLALKKIANISYDELAFAVLNADTKVLTPELLETIKFMSPTTDEASIIEAWLQQPQNKVDDLDTPSKFMVTMRIVPRMGEKVHAIITQSNWKTTVADMQRDIKTVVTACDEMLTSEHMHGWLQLVLAVGNYLNEGTNRGNCVGFELQFLMNLRDVKVTEANTEIKNLLQLLVDISHRADKQGIVHRLDCEHVQPATRVGVKHLISQLRVLNQNVSRIEKEVAAVVEAANDSETRFGLSMKLFTTTAHSDLRLLQTAAEDMEGKLEQVDISRRECFCDVALPAARVIHVCYCICGYVLGW
eukprot:INCI657.1.p1 GENE.INCI657.1~~INCI657.1.p1  ORF type:complete len:1732 (-),score=344.30 INCI657.1:1710-6905(-)